MPRRTQNQRAPRGRPKLRKRQNKSHSSKYPTHRQGPTAVGELIHKVPIFGKASHRVRLPYYETQLSLSSTAGAVATYNFSANGVYDPNITGTGHQPMGFDTLMLYYEQATVVSSKITVTAGNGGIHAARLAIALAPDTTTLTSMELMENGEIKSAVMDGVANQASNGSGYGTGNRLKTISLNCDVASYFGRRTQRELLDDVNLYCTAAANPTEQVYFSICTWGLTNSNGGCTFDVTVSYDVIFWEPRKASIQFSQVSSLLEAEEKKKGPVVPARRSRR